MGEAVPKKSRHEKIDVANFVTAKKSSYIDKYDEGRWYDLEEFCTLKGYTPKSKNEDARRQEMKMFIQSIGCSVEEDDGEEGVVVLDATPGRKIKIGRRTAAEKQKQQACANRHEAEEALQKLTQSLAPQASSLKTEAEVDQAIAELTRPKAESVTADSDGNLERHTVFFRLLVFKCLAGFFLIQHR